MEVIQYIGQGLTSGLHILQIHIVKQVELRIGALNNGNKISFDTGNYCYVGSAKGIKGSSTLHSRLLRHCKRTTSRKQHKILNHLQAFLLHKGMAFAISTQPKTNHWHIDYLLDDELVEISKILMVGNLELAEQDLVEIINNIGVFEAAVSGFGASDFPGSSHLFRIKYENGWNELAAQVGKIIFSA